MVEPKFGHSGGWQVGGEIRPQANFTGDPISGVFGPGGGVSLQAVFPESREHTVQLDFDNSADDNASVHVVRAVATVTWSIEGNSIVRRVSCLPGMALTGVAQGVKVVIQDASVIPVGQTMRPYRASILVAPGSRGSIQQPPYLEGDQSILVKSGSLNLQAPKGVGAISLYLNIASSSLGTPVLAGQFLAQMSGVGGVSLKAWDPVQLSGWIPLSPGTVTVLINSTAGAPDALVTPVWGIEG